MSPCFLSTALEKTGVLAGQALNDSMLKAQDLSNQQSYFQSARPFLINAFSYFLVHSMRQNVNMIHERVTFHDPNHARVLKYMRACVCTCVPARSFQRRWLNGIKRVSGVFPLLFPADERVLSARFDSNVVKNHSTKREQNPHLMPALSKYERLEFSSCPFGFYFVRIQLFRTQVSHVTRLFTVLSLFKIYAAPFLIFFNSLCLEILHGFDACTCFYIISRRRFYGCLGSYICQSIRISN